MFTVPEEPDGTVNAIEVLLQLVGLTLLPANVTVLPPWVEPKFEPEIVTEVPGPPDVGERLFRIGLGITVKVFGLLAIPPTVTITGPVVAWTGGRVKIWLALQESGEAVNPLKVTVLVPCVSPKPVPLMMTS